MKIKTLPLEIQMNRFSGGEMRRGVTITIRDAVSGTESLEITMTIEQFGLAVTGQATEAIGEWRVAHLGKKREIKRLELTVPDSPWDTRFERLAARLAQHEVDGWVGHKGDVFNMHTRVKGRPDTYSVGFTRFTESE